MMADTAIKDDEAWVRAKIPLRADEKQIQRAAHLKDCMCNQNGQKET